MQGPLKLKENIEFQKRIVNYFKGEKIHPAIIISGGSKETRLNTAKQIAKYLLCQNNLCESCRTCSRIEREIHPDVFIVKEEESAIKISVIREIISQVECGPLEEKYKICILEDSERMNNAAANAFLKTLEEPLNGRLFFLLTNKVHSLLPTIVSRCIYFNLKIEEPFMSSDNSEFLDIINRLKEPETLIKLPAIFSEEKKYKDFVLFLQTLIRDKILKNQENEKLSQKLLDCYEDTLETEKIISTNANSALAIEVLLRKHFIDL